MFLLRSTKLRKRLLNYAFTHTDEKFYVRELACLISEDPGNLSRELSALEKEGLFESSRKGNLKFYSINKTYPLFKELKDIIFKTGGVEGSLRELVLGVTGIKTAFIYGSYARQQEKESSDIDLCIIGKINENEWIAELNKVEKKLNREINYAYYGEAEFKEKVKEKGGFLNQVAGGKVIILKGDLNA